MGIYAGSILYLDLASGKIETKPLDMEFAREYVGGLGFGTKLFLDLIKENPYVDPLSANFSQFSSPQLNRLRIERGKL